MRTGELTAPASAYDASSPLAADVGLSRSLRGLGGRALLRRLVVALVAFDLATAAFAYAIAFAARSVLPVPLTSAVLPPQVAWQPHAALVLLLATQLPFLYVFGLYDQRLLRERLSPIPSVAAAVAGQLLVVTAWYFFRGEIAFPRSVLLLYVATNLGLVAASRSVARRLLRRGAAALRVALVGSPVEVAELYAQLAVDATRHGIVVVGAVRPPGVLPSAGGDAAPRSLGVTRDLAKIVRDHALEQLIVVPGATGNDELLESVLRASADTASCRVAVVPSVYELRVGRLASLRIDDVPLIEVARDPSDEIAFHVKAVTDYVVATVLLVVTLPICLLAALAIRIASRGPVIFRQRRVGQHGREFIVYKLRTMRDDAEHATGAVLACDNDSRVIGPGRLLRALRIDEIPQLLNVLNGSMSLVGPRPERPEFAEQLARTIPGYRERWLVKPGLTGLAQVHGEYHTSPAYKLKYDLAYIHNYTLLLDLRILLETVKTLLARRGV